MKKMSNEQILSFTKDFVDKLYEIGWYQLDEVVIRTTDITISLELLLGLVEARGEGNEEEYKKHFIYAEGWYESEDKLENIISRVAEDEDIEAVIFCEGALWEVLYYCEMYGSDDEKSNNIYQAFVKTVQTHSMWYEWGSGAIFLYGVS